MATYLGHQEDSSGNILLPTPHSMATQIEFGTTASQAYAKGAYVVFNNRLCKASTAIASGATLAIGTNLVQCSIGSELNSHLQAPNGNEFYFDYKDGKPGFYPSASKVASQFVPFGGSLIQKSKSISGAYYSTVSVTLEAGAHDIYATAKEPSTGNTFGIVADANGHAYGGGYVNGVSYNASTHVLKFTSTMGTWSGTVYYYV